MDTAALLEDIHRTVVVRSEWRKMLGTIEDNLLAESPQLQQLADQHDHSRQGYVAALGEALAETVGLIGKGNGGGGGGGGRRSSRDLGNTGAGSKSKKKAGGAAGRSDSVSGGSTGDEMKKKGKEKKGDGSAVKMAKKGVEAAVPTKTSKKKGKAPAQEEGTEEHDEKRAEERKKKTNKDVSTTHSKGSKPRRPSTSLDEEEGREDDDDERNSDDDDDEVDTDGDAFVQHHTSKPYLLQEPYMETEEKRQLVNECLEVVAKTVDLSMHEQGVLSQAEYLAYSDLVKTSYLYLLEVMSSKKATDDDGVTVSDKKDSDVAVRAVGDGTAKTGMKKAGEGVNGIACRAGSTSDAACETIVAVAQRKGFEFVNLTSFTRTGVTSAKLFRGGNDDDEDGEDRRPTKCAIQATALPHWSGIYGGDVRLGSGALTQQALHWLSQTRLITRQIPHETRRRIWIQRLLGDLVTDDDDDDSDLENGAISSGGGGGGGDGDGIADSGSGHSTDAKSATKKGSSAAAKDDEDAKAKGKGKKKKEKKSTQNTAQTPDPPPPPPQVPQVGPRRRRSGDDGRQRAREVSRTITKQAFELGIGDITKEPIMNLASKMVAKRALEVFPWFGGRPGEAHPATATSTAAAKGQNDSSSKHGDPGSRSSSVSGGGGGGGDDAVSGSHHGHAHLWQKSLSGLTARQKRWRVMCQRASVMVNQHYVFNGELKARYVSLALPLAYVLHGCHDGHESAEEEKAAAVANDVVEVLKNHHSGGGGGGGGGGSGGTLGDGAGEFGVTAAIEAALLHSEHWTMSNSCLLAMLDSLVSNFVPSATATASMTYGILRDKDPELHKHLKLVFPPGGSSNATAGVNKRPVGIGKSGKDSLSGSSGNDGLTSTVEDMMRSDKDDIIMTWAEDVLVGWLREEALMFVWDSFFITADGWQIQLPAFLADIAMTLRLEMLSISRPSVLYATVLPLTRAMYTRDIRARFRARMEEEDALP